ncbi:MAG: Coenzyme F420 hydrogenase/dehydrogenase, beta subunit C-terminal domain [Paludibacteraceae bacterium]|nr:Coenzyme F420 hydrogenase/dehydrogenase, beta subunit C-terminal domain [Paludibacteraceae bacterium]
MKPDALGFLYPKINGGLCVECGLCEKVCAFNNNYEKRFNLPKPDVYGVRHKDINEVMTSRSGAAFVAISDRILLRGGVVYGAGYTEHFRVIHKRATTKEECKEFKGSKYVQSDMTGVFRQVKKDLRNGLIVMFSGTPCQTAGLNSYVGEGLRERLYLVDILCHGVPGPKIWEDYLSFLEEKVGDKIIWTNFRDKERFGWAAHCETLGFKSKIQKTRIYSSLFSKDIMLRKSCYDCHYTNLVRPSDITLGDFWHSKEIDPTINSDNKGMSLLFANTEKGRKLLETVIEDFSFFLPVDVAKVMQKCMREPSLAHPDRDKFEVLYVKKGFEYVYKKYGREPFMRRFRMQICGWKRALNNLFNK